MKSPLCGLLAAFLVLQGACAQRVRERSVDQTLGTIRERTGLALDLQSDVFAAELLPEVRSALKAPLDADVAVRVAVLNNKRVRAQMASLGIVASELVAATRPPNPRVEGHAALDRRSARNGNYGGSLELGLGQLFSMRARRRVAQHDLAAEQVRVADAVMGFALEVRATFHDYVAARKLVALSEIMQESAQASLDAAQALLSAGNLAQLDFEMQRAFLEQSRLDTALAQRAEMNLREDLHSLLGLWGPYTSWSVVDDFPALPAADPNVEEVERTAIEQSLELAQLREHIEAEAAAAGLARIEGLVPDLSVGLDLDFEEGFRRVGPIVSAELPLFDQGQAGVMRALASLDEARALYVATAVEVRSVARRARNSLTIARQVVMQYQNAIMPLRQRVTSERLLQYNAMNAGVFELLASKRQELEASQDYIRALRDYWVARAELYQVQAGGALSNPRGASVGGTVRTSNQQGGH